MWTASFLLLLAAPALSVLQQGGHERQRRAAAQAVAGAFSTASDDGYSYGGGGGGVGGGGGGGDSFVFPGQAGFGPGAIHSMLRNYLDQMEAMFSQQQQQANSGGASGGFGGGNSGAAQASLALGNRGGFASAQLYPDPGPSGRIASELPPASGGPIGVFSSSSSSSHVDESGKTHTFKQATVGVNDNGKVKIFSVKDP